jgi:signal transduction histidine kinase
MEAPKLDVLELVKKVYNVDQLLFGKDYVREMVKSLAQTLGVKYVLVGHAVEPDKTAVQTDFLWSDGKFADNLVYDLKGTPCVNVICGTRVNCYAEKVAEQFPDDHMLKDLGAEAYVGAPFLTPDGSLVGLLVILDDKPLKDRELYTFVVEFFAARIGTEYYRQAFEDSLQKQVDLRTQELRVAFEDLKRTQRQLVSQEKLATIGRITFGIAHELKNPLNIIINAAEILQELLAEQNLSGPMLIAADNIRQHGHRANVIITTMLRQARQEPTADPEIVNLSEMIDRSLELCVRSILDLEFKSKLHIYKNIDADIAVKIVDAPSVERGFINLIDNALYALKEKFRAQGEHFAPELRVKMDLHGPNVFVHIHDNGTGVTDVNLRRIFDEFYTTKPPGEGTGLGLSIAKQVFEKNNGEISIKSTEGQFTEVRVSFPFVEKKAQGNENLWSQQDRSLS